MILAAALGFVAKKGPEEIGRVRDTGAVVVDGDLDGAGVICPRIVRAASEPQRQALTARSSCVRPSSPLMMSCATSIGVCNASTVTWSFAG